jgi:hypothetical protein
MQLDQVSAMRASCSTHICATAEYVCTVVIAHAACVAAGALVLESSMHRFPKMFYPVASLQETMRNKVCSHAEQLEKAHTTSLSHAPACFLLNLRCNSNSVACYMASTSAHSLYAVSRFLICV